MDGTYEVVIILWVCLSFVVAYGIYGVILYMRNFHKKHYFLKIQFPEVQRHETEEYIERMATIFDTLHKTLTSRTKKLSFELYKADGRIVFFLSSNSKDVLEQAKLSFGQMENTVISDSIDDPQITFTQKHKKIYTHSLNNTQDFYPITPNAFFIDGLTHIFDSFKTEDACICFVMRGVKKKEQIKFKIDLLERHQQGKIPRRLTPSEIDHINMYRMKLAENLFRVKVYIRSTDKSKLNSIISLFSQLNYARNSFHSKTAMKHNALMRYIAPETLLSIFPFMRRDQGTYLTSKELGTLLHPASITRGSHVPNQLKNISARPEFLEKREDNILIGQVSDSEGNKHKLYYPRKNTKRHIYMVGKTGGGKSTILHTFITDAIQDKNTTLFVVDPDGDLLIDVIHNTSDPARINYFAPKIEMKDTDRVLSFNPFFNLHEPFTHKNALRDMMLDIIKRETTESTGNYQTGAMTQNRIAQMLDILTEFYDAYYDYLIKKKELSSEQAKKIVQERQLTLNDLPYFLIEERNYYPLLKEIFPQDSKIGQYVHKEMPTHMINSNYNTAVIEAVRARFDQILHSSLRYTFEGNAISPDLLKDDSRIHLFPVSKSIYASHGQRIFTQMLFSLLYLHKIRVPKEERKNTIIVIDEFQNMQVDGLEDVLSSARKFDLSLIAANQQLGQLRDSVRDALFGNVGTLIALRLGGGKIGAEYLSREFGDQVSEQDLIQLPPFHAYMKTETADNEGIVRISFETIPLEQSEKNETVIKSLQEKTLQKYGDTIKNIEEKIKKKQEHPKRYFTDNLK